MIPLSPLMSANIFDAAGVNDYSTVHLLLSQFRNDPNELNENGLTALQICATFGHLETAKILIDFGAELDIKDFENGWTALHRAIYFDHPKFVLMLIQAGASYDNEQELRDKEGYSPSDLLSLQLQKDLLRSNKSKDAGMLISFGRADFTLGVPLPKSADTIGPKKLESLMMDSIVHMSASKHHALAVSKGGQVYSWGHGRCGRLGHAENHTLALEENGDVYSWGSDRFGQLGHGNNDSNRIITSPKRIEALRKDKVLGIAAGESHSLCFTSIGELYAWGSNKYGQLGVRVNETCTGFAGVCNSPVPKKISLPFVTKATLQKYTSVNSVFRITQVAASYNSSLLLVSSTNFSPFSRYPSYQTDIYQWGDGVFSLRKIHLSYHRNQALRPRSHSNNESSMIPEEHLSTVLDSNRIIQISAGKNYYVGLSHLGYVYTWGSGIEQLGHGIHEKQHSLLSPTIVEALLPENGGGKIVHVSAAGNRSYAVSDIGDLYTWGATDEKGILTPGMSMYQPTAKRVHGIKRAVQVAAAEDYTVVLISPSVPTFPVVPNIMVSNVNEKQSASAKSVKDSDDEDAEDEENESFPDFQIYDQEVLEDPDTWNLHPTRDNSLPLPNSKVTERERNSYHEDDIEVCSSVPSLKDLCQYSLCTQINVKNVLPALSFTSRYDSTILRSFCESYLRKNLDLILVQAKPLDIERYVDCITTSLHLDLSSSNSTLPLSRRKRTLSFDPSRKPSTSSGILTTGNNNIDPEINPRKASFVEDIPDKNVPIVLMEKKNYKDIDNSVELLKLIRTTKKKLQSIDELQKRISEDKYEPSKEQQEKIMKRGELVAELSKMEQYLVRLQVREDRQQGEPAIISTETPIVDQGKSQEQLQSMSSLQISQKELKQSVKPGVKISSIKRVVNAPVEGVVLVKETDTSKEKQSANAWGVKIDVPTSVPNFQQWGNFLQQDNSGSNQNAEFTKHRTQSINSLSEINDQESNNGVDIDGDNWHVAGNTSKTYSISSMLPNGRSVLSPSNVPARPPAPPPAIPIVLSRPIPAPTFPTSTTSTMPSSSKATRTANEHTTPSKSVGKSTFDLSDFLTPKVAKLSPQTASSPVVTNSNIPKSANAWQSTTPAPSSWSKPTNTISSLQSTEVSSASTSPAVVSSSSKKQKALKSFAEIQAEEEKARQLSNMMELKGNEIPWHIDRKPRAASLQTLIQQDLEAKEEEEFIQRELAKFAKLEEEEKLKKAQQEKLAAKKYQKQQQQQQQQQQNQPNNKHSDRKESLRNDNNVSNRGGKTEKKKDDTKVVPTGVSSAVKTTENVIAVENVPTITEDPTGKRKKKIEKPRSRSESDSKIANTTTDGDLTMVKDTRPNQRSQPRHQHPPKRKSQDSKDMISSVVLNVSITDTKT